MNDNEKRKKAKRTADTAATAALNKILEDVLDVTGVTAKEILSRSRGYESTSLARFFAYTMMREHDNGFSLQQIGDVMVAITAQSSTG